MELGVEIGVEKGVKRGIEQGIEQGIRNVARNLINVGMSVSEISKATGLSESEVEGLI